MTLARTRPPPLPRLTVEQVPVCVEAGAFMRDLRQDQSGRWERWERGGGPVLFAPITGAIAGATVTASASLWGGRGHVRLVWRTDEARGEQVVELLAHRSPTSVPRWLFVCPASSRFCATLYLPPKGIGFAGRIAHRLVYASQGRSPAEQAAWQARRLRKALGQRPPDLGAPFPDQPQRMRREVYLAAVEMLRHWEAEAMVGQPG